MSSLKEYTEGSEKSGYYILANVGGPHPITLQVSDLGQQIFQKTGHNPGENVPSKIVWAMFDVGILYTTNTINEPPDVIEETDQIFRELNLANRLTEEERHQLVQYLEEYQGPNKAQVESLREELQNTGSSANSLTIPEEVREDLDRISRLRQDGDLTNREYDLLKSRILDRRESIDDDSNDGQHPSDQVEMDIRDWMTEDRVANLIEHYRALIPENEPGPYDEDETEDFVNYYIPAIPSEISSTPSASFSSPTLGHMFYFTAKEQEERFRELLELEEQYKVTDDSTGGKPPWIWVDFNVAPSGYSADLTDEDILREINHLFRAISHTFEVTTSELASADVSWE